MADFVLSTRLWAIVCLGTLGVTVLLSLFGHLVGPRIWGESPGETEAAGQVMLPIFFGLFLVLGFSALPLAANLFVAGLERMWGSAGLLDHPLNAKVMALIHQHHVHFVLAVWGMFAVGLVIAAPHILRDLAAERSSPVSAPKGTMPPLEYQVRHAKQKQDLQNQKQTTAAHPSSLPLLPRGEGEARASLLLSGEGRG